MRGLHHRLGHRDRLQLLSRNADGERNKKTMKIIGLGKSISVLGVVLWICGGIMGCIDPGLVIVVERPTEVLPEMECNYHEGKEIALLNKGDSLKVIGINQLKACMVYKIKLPDGRVGYVTNNSDYVKVIEVKK
jgi:hypothetical protein